MDFKVWKAKRTLKKIMYYDKKILLFQNYIKEIRAWKRREQKILKECGGIDGIIKGNN